jgi:mono/diheme cytochrome c family protein
MDAIPLDPGRRIDPGTLPTAPTPAPTKQYGEYLGKLCQGCHGHGLSGGPLPGAPPELPVPLNLTPHETGLKGWTYDDFNKLLTEAVRKNGKPLNPFMPIETMKHLNDTEKQALWAYLQSLPPTPFGGR